MKKFIIFLAFSFFFAFEAFAQVSTVQAISFGDFISRNNNAQYDITVNPNGTFSYDPSGFFIISSPSQGIYDITTPQINTAIVSVDVTQGAPLTGAGGSFTLVGFQSQHSGTTDGAGVARVTIGATVRTSGNGSAYLDQTYTGSIDIEINF